MRHDTIQAILADLMVRVDALASQHGHVSGPRLHDEVDQIRYIARAYQLDEVENLAGTLESALSLHGLGPVVLSYLDLMRDALCAGLNDGAGAASMVPLIHCSPVAAQLRA